MVVVDHDDDWSLIELVNTQSALGTSASLCRSMRFSPATRDLEVIIVYLNLIVLWPPSWGLRSVVEPIFCCSQRSILPVVRDLRDGAINHQFTDLFVIPFSVLSTHKYDCSFEHNHCSNLKTTCLSWPSTTPGIESHLVPSFTLLTTAIPPWVIFARSIVAISKLKIYLLQTHNSWYVHFEHCHPLLLSLSIYPLYLIKISNGFV